MKEIIAPIAKELLLKELNKETFLRHTNKGGNEIYIINDRNAPNTLLEIGRLRECAFRNSGGGSGLECDLDSEDSGPFSYQQLIVWDPEALEIIGGYRFVLCKNAIDAEGQLHLSTTHYFDFSDTFIKEFLPYTLELGRSFVQPKYQGKEGGKKALFSLDNLWDGLGALVVKYPEIKYFFGKVTMYKSFNQEARDLILAFMNFEFPDKDGLVKSKPELVSEIHSDVKPFIDEIKSLDYKTAYNTLNNRVKSFGENVPPLINNYMSLSATMRTFETANNPDFGDVEETCILVTIKDIYHEKSVRHIQTYLNEKDQ
ncbi:MAG TPA: GNAT family N-acetyltransferase [Edaphocola sp.]|nr:GNAT family N-acetyltransferase [Edaphocola sp.]